MHSAEGEPPLVRAHTSGLWSPLRGGLGVARHQWLILGRGQLGETAGAQASSAALQMAAARPRPQRLRDPFPKMESGKGENVHQSLAPPPRTARAN